MYINPPSTPSFTKQDNTSVYSDIVARQSAARESDRLQMQKWSQAMENTKASELIADQNTKELSGMADDIEETIFQALSKKSVSKIIGEPSLSAQDIYEVDKKIKSYSALADRLNTERETLAQAERAIDADVKAGGGTFDADMFNRLKNEYYTTGKLPSSGKFLVPAAHDPYVTMSKPAWDFRPAQEKTFRPEGIDPSDPSRMLYKSQGMTEEQQFVKFNDEMINNVNFQRGVVNEFVKSNNPNRTLNRVIGSLDDFKQDATREEYREYEQRALRMLDEYNDSGVLKKDLLEAANTWATLDEKMHTKGGTEKVQSRFDESLYKAGIKEKKEAIDPLDKPTQALSLGGAEIKAKDLRGEGFKVQDIDRPKGKVYKFKEGDGWVATSTDEFAKTEEGKRKDADIVAVSGDKIFVNQGGVLFTFEKKGNEWLLKSDKQRKETTTGRILGKGSLDK